jgi:hypothetical protein
MASARSHDTADLTNRILPEPARAYTRSGAPVAQKARTGPGVKIANFAAAACNHGAPWINHFAESRHADRSRPA